MRKSRLISRSGVCSCHPSLFTRSLFKECFKQLQWWCNEDTHTSDHQQQGCGCLPSPCLLSCLHAFLSYVCTSRHNGRPSCPSVSPLFVALFRSAALLSSFLLPSFAFNHCSLSSASLPLPTPFTLHSFLLFIQYTSCCVCCCCHSAVLSTPYHQQVIRTAFVHRLRPCNQRSGFCCFISCFVFVCILLTSCNIPCSYC